MYLTDVSTSLDMVQPFDEIRVAEGTCYPTKKITMDLANGTENAIKVGNLFPGTYLLRLAGQSGVKFEVK